MASPLIRFKMSYFTANSLIHVNSPLFRCVLGVKWSIGVFKKCAVFIIRLRMYRLGLGAVKDFGLAG